MDFSLQGFVWRRVFGEGGRSVGWLAPFGFGGARRAVAGRDGERFEQGVVFGRGVCRSVLLRCRGSGHGVVVVGVRRVGRCVGGGLLFGDVGVVDGGFFVAGERDVGARLEELLPELGRRLGRAVCGTGFDADLGTFPDILGVLGILFDDGEDARRHYSVGSIEVVINF